MAIFALRQRVRANQREAVLMVPNGLQGNLPSFDGVTTGAIGAELALVNVGVAIGALRADVLEHHAGMTLGASHFLMHGAQRVAGQIMIEIRIGSYGLPACTGVASSARNGNRTMRIGDLGLRRFDAAGDTKTATGAPGRIPIGIAFRFAARVCGGTATRCGI